MKTILSSVLLTLCLSTVVYADSSCQAYEDQKSRTESSMKRNKFLNVKNSKSGLAPSNLEAKTELLKKECEIELAKAADKTDKVLAKPKVEAIDKK